MSRPATGDLREDARRKLRHAQRLNDAALDHYAIADELLAEAKRAVDEAMALEAGTRPLPRVRHVLPDLRH